MFLRHGACTLDQVVTQESSLGASRVQRTLVAVAFRIDTLRRERVARNQASLMCMPSAVRKAFGVEIRKLGSCRMLANRSTMEYTSSRLKSVSILQRSDVQAMMWNECGLQRL